MKKLILITLILLLHSFPSFGDPKGNGLFCNYSDTELVKKDRFDKRVKSYYFRDLQNVCSFYFFEDKEIVETECLNSSYNYNVNYIKWYQTVYRSPNIFDHNKSTSEKTTYMNVLNRKTLKLNRVNITQLEDNELTTEEVLRCSVINGLTFGEFVERYRNDYLNKYQNELEQIKQKNKI